MSLRREVLTSLGDDVDLERDRALVTRCQAGDSTAFGNLYARYYDRTLRFCLGRLHDRHEAEDATQETFTRAWKALPNFAGERRFYPWLLVIAGNICTDVLRGRSRSTPRADLGLAAERSGEAVGADTSEDVVFATVDGDLLNRALDRLTTRHRNVISMRERSGWTYQQIADHEGVGVGTVQALLWRARQALKREFVLLSEGKEALAGFLVVGAAFLRRMVQRLAHRGARLQSQTGGFGGLRGAVAGIAATGAAAVAVTFVTPPVLSSIAPGHAAPTSTKAGVAVSDPHPHVAPAPNTAAARHSAEGTRIASGPGSTDAKGSGGPAGSTGSPGPAPGGGSGSAATPPSGDVAGAAAGGAAAGPVGGSTNGTENTSEGLAGVVNGLASGLGNTLNGATAGLGQTVNGLATGLGNTVGGPVQNLPQTVNGALSGLTNAAGGVVSGATGAGGVDLPSSSAGGTSTTGSVPQTQTTTTPGPLGEVSQTATQTVNGLLGG